MHRFDIGGVPQTEFEVWVDTGGDEVTICFACPECDKIITSVPNNCKIDVTEFDHTCGAEE